MKKRGEEKKKRRRRGRREEKYGNYLCMETRDLYGILVWKLFVYGSLWVCMDLVWILVCPISRV